MQNKNKKSSVCGKWFAYPVADETVDLAALAHHMEEHNTGFSEAMCLGMMTGMVKCIKEMLLQGKNVKIDNLAIFSVGIKNKEGADSEDDEKDDDGRHDETMIGTLDLVGLAHLS